MSDLALWGFAVVIVLVVGFCIAQYVVTMSVERTVRQRLEQRTPMSMETWQARYLEDPKVDPDVVREVLTTLSTYLPCRPTQILPTDRFEIELCLDHWLLFDVETLYGFWYEEIPELMESWEIVRELPNPYLISTVGELIVILSEWKEQSYDKQHSRNRPMSNTIVWVDIPVLDLDRAISFYSTVLGKPVSKEGGPGFVFGLLPHTQNNVAGCLYIGGEENAPSKTGVLVYLNVEGRLDQAIDDVKANGGQVLQEKSQIGEHGFRAIILDSEGNRVALHAPTA